MVQERTSGSAGLHPAVPPRPVQPPEPEVTIEREPVAEMLPEPPALSGPIPVEEQPLDPRAIARASLAAGRNASLWWVSGGIAVAIAVSLLIGTRVGSLVLAAVVAACAVVRWTSPAPGPVALSVRARWIDVSVLAALAVGLGGAVAGAARRLGLSDATEPGTVAGPGLVTRRSCEVSAP